MKSLKTEFSTVADRYGRQIGFLVVSIVLVAVLVQFSRISYLLFHSIAEIYSIVIAFAVFIISWNVRNQIENRLLVFLGIAYLFIGIIDLFHTLSYVGMNIFTDYDYYANQLWIGARYIESISLLLFFTLSGKSIQVSLPVVVLVYAGVTTALMLSIFYWKIFPVCFVAGEGLTPFKKFSEYIISAILLIALALQYKKRHQFDLQVGKLLQWAIILTILGELAFTFYISNYGLSNLVGHFLKIGSFYLVYKALVETGLVRPFDLLLIELKSNERRLITSETQLKISLENLKQEMAVRQRAEERVRENLKEKELLLQEIHHRVKNNMGLVSGFLALQSNSAKNDETKTALNDCQNRVQTISLIHETIYQSDDLSTIDINLYLTSLIPTIARGLNINENIHIAMNVDHIPINARQASPIGIIINELVTNALKYAFPGGLSGEIVVSVTDMGDRQVKLVISDNGVGIPKEALTQKSSKLGLALVNQIVEKQLSGKIGIESTKGTLFTIEFHLTDI